VVGKPLDPTSCQGPYPFRGAGLAVCLEPMLILDGGGVLGGGDVGAAPEAGLNGPTRLMPQMDTGTGDVARRSAGGDLEGDGHSPVVEAPALEGLIPATD